MLGVLVCPYTGLLENVMLGVLVCPYTGLCERMSGRSDGVWRVPKHVSVRGSVL